MKGPWIRENLAWVFIEKSLNVIFQKELEAAFG